MYPRNILIPLFAIFSVPSILCVDVAPSTCKDLLAYHCPQSCSLVVRNAEDASGSYSRKCARKCIEECKYFASAAADSTDGKFCHCHGDCQREIERMCHCHTAIDAVAEICAFSCKAASLSDYKAVEPEECVCKNAHLVLLQQAA